MNDKIKKLLINIFLVVTLFSLARGVNIAIYSDNQIIREASNLQNLLGIMAGGLVGVLEPKWLLISCFITLIFHWLLSQSQSLPIGAKFRRVFAITIPLIISLSIYLTIYHSKQKNVSIKSIRKTHSMSWEEKETLQKNKNRQVASLVDFQIIREDKEGNQLPLDGGCKDKFSFKVKYRDSLVLSDEYACHMDIVFHQPMKNEHLVLFEHSGHGVGGEKQTLVAFSNDKAIIVQSDYFILGATGKVENDNDSIILKDFAGCGQRSIGIYKNQKITWHKETIEVPDGLDGMKKYAVNNDAESILLIPKVSSTLRKLMRDKYSNLESLLCHEWSHRRTTSISGDLVIIRGVPQRFGRYTVWDDAFLSVNSLTGEIYAAYLAHGYDRSPNVLYGFSSKPALFAEPPKEFKEWMKQYSEAQEHWIYGE
jgi:hypothetical protein